MSGFPIITADERLKEKKGIKGVIFGKSGIGKTSLLWTLNPKTTLFVDLEAGDLAVQGWEGDALRPKTWQDCRDLAVFMGGANPSFPDDQSYSQAHYDAVCEKYGDPKALEKYDTIFIDSITVVGRMCFGWCKRQPEAFSEKTGKPDTRGAYGLHGQEMIAWLSHLHYYTRDKHIWLVGIMDEKLDDFNRKVFTPQIEGSKTGNELPGIFDQIITMAEMPANDGTTYRAFVTHQMNPYGFDAKDRSGRLELLEKPHLGELMAKIKGEVKPASERLVYQDPQTETPAETTPETAAASPKAETQPQTQGEK